GATGHGEESIKVCASFLAVEKMREGLSPLEACRYVCQRIVDRHNGRPLFGFKMVALDKKGGYGCCSVRGQIDAATKKLVGLGVAIHDAQGHRVEPGLALLPPMTEAERSSVPWR
ncbi:MAG: isoaspartyl peptidase/L-asparaginase, partial [Longimicrobiales bacterium]|nr:isoaspartyl peptidase/L-asparaginase [Longimicrobiales bacterium]